ncbi:MAG TPA: SMP-30/gluconolactonase/LRE family protein [Steroidobacteraceae bacterium]|nr:SMP-30/gluconolactonase/LRE family protein [Steroidobacteraceae bacterium]
MTNGQIATAECVWPLGARLGEGPTWNAATGELWFVDIHAGQVHALHPASGTRRSFTAPESTAFIFPCVGGGYLCGLRSGLFHFDPLGGKFERRVRVDAEHPGNRLNDGYVDAAGRLWFGTMDDAARQPSGSLYRYDGTRLERMDSGYVITNGPAMSPDGRVLYHVETQGRRMYAFDVDASGALSGKREFLAIDEPGVYPDGPVVDTLGNIWLSLYGGWGVRCYNPQGKLLRKLELPVARCTKVAFGGPALSTLYITTAAGGLSAEELAQQPLAGGLFRAQMDVAGLQSHVFAGW